MPSSPWALGALAAHWMSTPSTAAATALLLVLSILLVRARRRYSALPLLPAVPPGPQPPDCMVVIPARNEEGVVGLAVRSFPPDTVIVVDDHSTDGTAEEARAAGAGVLEAPPLIQGASGKASACMAGARILTSRWILFADADTRCEPGFLESAIQRADIAGLALLAVHLPRKPETLAEQAIEPYTSALFFTGASLRGGPAEAFQGQCILVRREAYEFIGGHAAVWRYLAEDVKLALLAQRHRMGFDAVRAAGLGHTRGHAGWKGVRSAIERNAFRFVQVNLWMALRILGTAACAALWLPLAAWLAFTGHRVAPWILVLLVLALLRPWYGGWRVVLAPLAIYAALPVLGHGLIRALADRRIEWKGRTVKAT